MITSKVAENVLKIVKEHESKSKQKILTKVSFKDVRKIVKIISLVIVAAVVAKYSFSFITFNQGKAIY